jgi:WD40 repeat protein
MASATLRFTALLCAGVFTSGLSLAHPVNEEGLPPGAVARLGTTRFRSTARALAISADGKTFLTVAGGRTVGIWDTATGKLTREFHLPGPAAYHSWLSPEGKWLAAYNGEQLEIWNLVTRKRQLLVPLRPMHLAFSADDRTLAIADYLRDKGGRIHLWDLETGQGKLFAQLPTYTKDIAFDPSGRRLFVLVDHHGLRCWEVSSGKQLWQNAHSAAHLTVSPDGKTLCTNTYLYGPLCFWHASTGRQLDEPFGSKDSWTSHLLFSPDGKTIAQMGSQGVQLWDARSRKLLHRLPPTGNLASFTPDSTSLLTLNHLVERWDLRTGKPVYPDTRGEGHVGPILALAFSPDGKSLATSGQDRAIRLWTLASGKHRVLRTDPEARRTSAITPQGIFVTGTAVLLAFTPDGRLLLSDTGPSTLALTDVQTGKAVQQFSLPTPQAGWLLTGAARLTEDGKRVIVLGHTMQLTGSSLLLTRDEPVHSWEVATGKEVLARELSIPSRQGAAFSPDGRLLVLPHEKQIREVPSGRAYPLHDAPQAIGRPHGFSPDGRLLAAVVPGLHNGPGKAILVWEVLSGQLLAHIEADLGLNSALAFSPDSQLLAASGADALHVWDILSGKCLLHVPARGRLLHWNGFRFACCLAFARDGQTLASGHDNGTVLLWDLAPAWKRRVPRKPEPVATCWEALRADDPGKAYRAMADLAATSKEALALLKRHLRPVRVDADWLKKQIADLNSSSFATREEASKNLARVRDAVESKLRQALGKARSPEARARLERLLESPGKKMRSGKELRQLRSLSVLERIGSNEARELLRAFASGEADAPFTREAQAALRRAW